MQVEKICEIPRLMGYPCDMENVKENSCARANVPAVIERCDLMGSLNLMTSHLLNSINYLEVVSMEIVKKSNSSW